MKHLKLFFALFAMLAIGVGNAWGEEATITFKNQSSGTSDGSSVYTTSDFVSSGIASSDDAFGTITCSATSKCYSGKTGMGLKVGGSSAAGSFTITFSTPLVNVSKVTLNAAAYRDDRPVDITVKNGSTQLSKITSITNETLYDIDIADLNIASFNTLTIESTKYCYIKSITITYNPSAGGEDPGTGGETPGTGGGSANVTYDFTKIDGFSSWPTSYANGKGDVVYTEATIKFTGAVKQTSTITDCPVTKGGQVQLVLNEAYADRDIANITFVCRQWGTKTQTITLHYSTDKGVSYTTTEITSTNFTISSAELPEGTNAVKITFSSSSNQVGIESVTFSLSSGEGSSSGETPELTNDQFAWSAATAEATMGASNTFPTLTNTLPVTVTYESSNTDAATIAANGDITLVAPGTTTISAKFAGGEVSGTTYAPKTVTYVLTVLKAPATPTENVYVKVTETASITDGEYLIVYEDAEGNPKAPVAFNGSLTTLDAAGNMMSVTITDNVINGNTEIDEVTFTISTMTGGYAIKSKSGKYIGRTSSGNGMNTGASEYLNIITITDGKTTISGSGDGASTSLQYYSVSGSERFRYYGSNQKPIALYKKVDPSEILAPAFSVAAGSFYDAQSVVITCATPGAEIYYTLDGSTPSSTSTKYTSAVAISETKTLKAIAIKGEYSSSVTEATYTILAPLATMQEIFEKATAVGNTATPVKVTMNNWVVTGVKGSNAYLTDGTKGLIIYTASHGFKVGDILSGTVACKVQLYDGSSELTELTKTTEGLTVTTGGTVTPVVVNDVTTLSGVNTGSVIKITGVCEKKTINDKEYYYVADVQLYNSLFAYTNPTVGNKYNVTGVYLQYGDVEEILPRKQEDIEEVQDLATATISVSNISLEVDETKTIEATITPAAAADAVAYSTTSSCISISGNTITGVTEGTATVTAAIANADGEYYGTTKDFKVTVTPKSTKDKVVILAQYDGKWYALKADKVDNKTIAALEVTYFDGKLYNVDDEDKALIEWERAVVDGNATFKNGENYLSAVNSADLKLSTTACDWVYEDGIYKIESSDRTFLYRAAANGFKNYDKDNADTDDYSSLPVVTAPVYVTSEVALTGKFSTGKYEYAQFAPGNLQYNVGSSTWAFAANQYDVIGDDNINVGDPTFTGTIDMFGWSTNETTYGVDPRNVNEYYDGDFVDWSNLFPVEDNWSTLSADQWKYLLNTRPNASSLKQIARVGSVVGIMLFPDNWNKAQEVQAVDDDYFKVKIYNYTKPQWDALEAAGAIFLPAAGRRAGGYGNMTNKDQVVEDNPANLNGGHYKHQDNTNIYCYYWTSTINESKDVSYLHNIQALGGGKYTIGTGAIWGEKGRYGQSVRLAKVTSTLIEIGDGNNSEVIEANKGETVNVKVNRTFMANDGYYTICLPFDLAAEKIGKAYQIQTITEHVAGEGINVEFTEVNTLTAGQPYLLLPSKNLENPIFEGVTIVNTTGDAAPTVSGEGINIAFTGIINGGGNTNGTSEYYVGNGGYLYNGTTAKLGLRAFFTITDNNGNPAKVRARVVVGENTTTDLENILNGENTTIKVIENGQLIIIRNGEKFNAQGQKL